MGPADLFTAAVSWYPELSHPDTLETLHHDPDSQQLEDAALILGLNWRKKL